MTSGKLRKLGTWTNVKPTTGQVAEHKVTEIRGVRCLAPTTRRAHGETSLVSNEQLGWFSGDGQTFRWFIKTCGSSSREDQAGMGWCEAICRGGEAACTKSLCGHLAKGAHAGRSGKPRIAARHRTHARPRGRCREFWI